MQRRTFMSGAAGAVLAGAEAALEAKESPIPIIDTHIHLFDPTRPQGVPWPPKDAVMYRPSLPDRFREVTKGMNIRGAIEVECSPWFDDNQWVLDVEAKDPIMVGMVGDLEPGKPEFPRQLERFHKNPLFLGIRYGYLWDRDLRAELAKPEFIAGLRMLAEAGLELDTANSSQRLLSDMQRLTDQAPELRVVIDHLPAMETPRERAARAEYDASLRDLGKRHKVYVKVSEVLHRTNGGKIHYDLGFHREKLDQIWEAFGPDRVLYGSDWPNSEPVGTYAQVLSVVREYFHGKGREAAEKFFWKNSVAAYRWVKRAPDQPDPARA